MAEITPPQSVDSAISRGVFEARKAADLKTQREFISKVEQNPNVKKGKDSLVGGASFLRTHWNLDTQLEGLKTEHAALKPGDTAGETAYGKKLAEFNEKRTLYDSLLAASRLDNTRDGMELQGAALRGLQAELYRVSKEIGKPGASAEQMRNAKALEVQARNANSLSNNFMEMALTKGEVRTRREKLRESVGDTVASFVSEAQYGSGFHVSPAPEVSLVQVSISEARNADRQAYEASINPFKDMDKAFIDSQLAYNRSILIGGNAGSFEASLRIRSEMPKLQQALEMKNGKTFEFGNERRMVNQLLAEQRASLLASGETQPKPAADSESSTTAGPALAIEAQPSTATQPTAEVKTVTTADTTATTPEATKVDGNPQKALADSGADMDQLAKFQSLIDSGVDQFAAFAQVYREVLESLTKEQATPTT